MRVVTAVLADERAARALVQGWLSAGCPATRLHLFARIGMALDRAAPSDATPSLVRLARHGPLVLWALETPPGERRRSTRFHRRRRRALVLLGRLADDGAGGDWRAHARALADGRPLGVARLGRDESDPVACVRPLLAHAVAPVRVYDFGVSGTWSGGRPGVAARRPSTLVRHEEGSGGQWQPAAMRERWR